MNSIKEKFKDRFEEFAGWEFDRMVMTDEEWLLALDSIDQYHNEVVEELQKRINNLESQTLIYRRQAILNRKSISDLEERNRGLLEALEEVVKRDKGVLTTIPGDDPNQVFNIKFVPIDNSKYESLIAKYKGGDGEERKTTS